MRSSWILSTTKEKMLSFPNWSNLKTRTKYRCWARKFKLIFSATLISAPNLSKKNWWECRLFSLLDGQISSRKQMMILSSQIGVGLRIMWYVRNQRTKKHVFWHHVQFFQWNQITHLAGSDLDFKAQIRVQIKLNWIFKLCDPKNPIWYLVQFSSAKSNWLFRERKSNLVLRSRPDWKLDWIFEISDPRNPYSIPYSVFLRWQTGLLEGKKIKFGSQGSGSDLTSDCISELSNPKKFLFLYFLRYVYKIP